jgi:Phage regulatory protein CII (CP76)
MVESNNNSVSIAFTIFGKIWNRFPLASFKPILHFHVMQSYELLHEVFEKTAPKKIGADLNLSESMIYKWAQPQAAGSGASNPLDRVEALLKSTGDHRIVQWICQRAGGFFILNPKNTPHPHYMIPATNQIVQEFADLLHVIATATADEKILPPEARQIRARWEELKSVTEGFVTCCERGNFDRIRDIHNKRVTTAQQPQA